MKRYSVLPVIIVLAGAVQAQQVSEIFEQLSAPKPAAPAVTAEPGLTVSQPAAAIEPVAETVVIQTVSQPAVVEVVVPAPVVAVEAVSAAVERKEEMDEVIQTIAAQPEAEVSAAITGGLITLSLKEVELNSVIRLFATLSGANIIIPDLGAEAGVAKVDINLKDVAWRPALQAILDSHDLELFEKIPGSQVYSVRKKLADAPPPMHVKIFKLNYATVTGVSEMLRNMVPEPGKISVFPARNTIVVQSSPENLVEVEYMISSVDFPRQQVFIEAKFLELTDSASEKLGIDWQVLGGYGVSAGPFSGNYSRTRTDSRQTGVGGAASAPETYETPAGQGLFINNPDSIAQTLESQTVTALLGADRFALVLAALRETGGTKVVSNPKIIVANEETATIHIGKKKPNVKGTTQTAGESQVTVTYALDADEPYFEDGIKVNVTPTVNTAENITVKIQPTLDRLDTDAQAFTAPDGTRFYGKSTKTIDTLFSLESGQTAAIGGLTQTSNDEVERKVPVLGSLPLLGRFFSYTSKVNGQTETIIFVTVGLANPENVAMATGLPTESSLAMRQTARMQADRQIRVEELKLLEQHEAERARKAVQELRDAAALKE